jgi:hypothetical protein
MFLALVVLLYVFVFYSLLRCMLDLLAIHADTSDRKWRSLWAYNSVLVFPGLAIMNVSRLSSSSLLVFSTGQQLGWLPSHGT